MSQKGQFRKSAEIVAWPVFWHECSLDRVDFRKAECTKVAWLGGAYTDAESRWYTTGLAAPCCYELVDFGHLLFILAPYVKK